MARSNKYASINFNHIYDKNLSPNTSKQNPQSSSSSSSSYSALSSPNNSYKDHTRSHGRMLVLSRPAPKPITAPSPPPPQLKPHQQSSRSVSGSVSDSISLRPLGTTGSGSGVLNLDKDKDVLAVTSPKPNRFVPPHLRPGFVGKEERPVPETFRSREAANRNLQQQGILGSPGRHGEDARPSSGGYGRMRDGNLGFGSRPRSSGNRPNSSG